MEAGNSRPDGVLEAESAMPAQVSLGLENCTRLEMMCN